MSFGWDHTGLLALAALGWAVAACVNKDMDAAEFLGTVAFSFVVFTVLAVIANIINPLHLLGSP